MRQFCCRIGGDGGAFQIAHRLERRDGVDPSFAGLVRQCQCVTHSLHLRLLKLRFGSGDALFARARVQQVDGDHAFQCTVQPQLRRADAQQTDRDDRVFRRGLLPCFCR